MNPRLRAVIRKEFREYRRNRMIVLTMAIMPIVFLAIALVPTLAIPDNTSEKVVKGLVGQALLYFLVVPVVIPTTVAAYSVIGEREQGTLEPTLTTPVTDSELLLGKALAATVPAVLLAWALFALFAGVVQVFGSARVAGALWDTHPVAMVLLLVPALAGFAIVVGLAISVRSTDIRVAQQLAGLASLPVFGGIVVLSMGLVEPTRGMLAAAAAVIGAIDVAGWRGVTVMFDRERLLTRHGRPA